MWSQDGYLPALSESDSEEFEGDLQICLRAAGGTAYTESLEARPKPWNVLEPRSPEWSTQVTIAALALGQLPLEEKEKRREGRREGERGLFPCR